MLRSIGQTYSSLDICLIYWGQLALCSNQQDRHVAKFCAVVIPWQKVRFSTSILFCVSVGLEMLTPVFPHHFLLLATLANIAKSISLAAYLATSVRTCSLFFCAYQESCPTD